MKLLEINIKYNELIAELLEFKNSQTEVYPDETFFRSNNLSTDDYPKIIHGYIIPDELRESFYESDDDGFRVAEDFEYHSSWNWLMPAIEKYNNKYGINLLYSKNCFNIYNLYKSLGSQLTLRKNHEALEATN